MLEGKWVWVWNWRRCLDGDPVAVARRLKDAGCAGVFLKAGDGGHDFAQGAPIAEIIASLQDEGVRAVPWFYWYLYDEPLYCYGAQALTWQEEAENLIATCIRLGAAAAVIDIEAESEKAADPEANAYRALSLVKARLPDLALYYAPLPQPNYHRRLPYRVFNRYCRAALPQAYHNAMQVAPEEAVALCYDAFAAEGLLTLPLAPAGGAYGSVTPEELERWARAAVERGATMLSWWSFEHIDADCPQLWDAIARVELPEEIDMDEDARKGVQANAVRQRIAGRLLSGDPALAEQAYREMQYLRLLAGLPIAAAQSEARSQTP
jgi:hypothetical protein